MKKTNTKSKSKSQEKTKKPILSTGKKIGLTVYFTFIFTLMGIMGLQIWMNSMNGNLSNGGLTSPQPIQTEQPYEQAQNNSTYNGNEYAQNYAVNETQQNNPSITNTENSNLETINDFQNTNNFNLTNTNYSEDAFYR